MKKVGLIILDGWGIGKKDQTDAVYQANTPVMDGLMNQYPHTTLTTFGEAVGLPNGQMGNSEVGHLNIGAGRVVYQELTRINKSIREGDFFTHPQLLKAMSLAKEEGKALHLMGLVSRGGVHSSQDHLHALIDMAIQENVPNVFIHAFTDGRDCDPKSGRNFIAELEQKVSGTKVQIASVIGRFFSMDRDNRWERVQEAYHLMVSGQGTLFPTAGSCISHWYEKDKTDEFIPPSIIETKALRTSSILENDVVISFNFRTDRPREITTALTQKNFQEFGMKALKLPYFTMTSYDETFKNIEVIFEKDNLKNTLGEVISAYGKTQIRIAETEKYPHVTFFFSGGREVPFEGETRLMVNSPKVATYDLQPEMSAEEVKEKIVAAIQNETPDFFCLNFANPDMVGHTGVFSAIVKAVEKVDTCVGEIVAAGLNKGMEFLIIADHGNADLAINPDGSPNTAHSLNPVPAILVTKENLKLKAGKLADVATTILDRMSISPASEMTGESLVVK
ncbi:MAG: 2,3-bisphosphoglycerate-independent phosphoglycerate mutase [Bacteroidetes bacterium]|nr:2,3-bisphosphoglycerate-independent phosphoglycerate mutase [Bacteroidota bacterium]